MKIENSQAILTKQDARALVAHASTDVTRMQMNAVCVDWAHGACAATDGHRLARVNGQPPIDRAETLIPRDVLERAAKSCPRGGSIVIEPAGNGATVTVVDGGHQPISVAHVPEVHGKFPPYMQALPEADREPAPYVGANSGYLADLELVCEAALAADPLNDKGKRRQRPGITLGFGGSLDPIRCTVGEWTIAIMPMRI